MMHDSRCARWAVLATLAALAYRATGLIPAPAATAATSSSTSSRRRFLLGGGSTWAAIAGGGVVAAPPPADAVEGAFEMDMRFYAKQILNGNDQTTKRPTDDVPEVTKCNTERHLK